MNFTRDPIIETVITPREGCKLVIRSSKGAKQEEYLVDAVEVVSFGHSFFFRSIERPKSFLVPISDYEVFEAKETKLILKNASSERSIKIGGGRESSRPSRESAKSEESSESGDKKPKRRRSRKSKDRSETPAQKTEGSAEAVQTESQGSEETKAPSFISKLFPPPTTLIRETLGKYKTDAPAPEDLSQIEESETSSESDQDLGKIEEQTPPDTLPKDNPDAEE